jgi:ATP-dependent helicase/nuclease subunit B
MSLSDAISLILTQLADVTQRPVGWSPAPIAIYGLLEARLMTFDVAVLGGLNEGVWPAIPDSGPWLNRPMRDTFGLQQPERNIGLTAHDLVAGFGHGEVYLTWSQRIGTDPATPSRWILRLRTVMAACGVSMDKQRDVELMDQAQRMDRALEFRPMPKPAPTPPVSHRPRDFSVTEIEKLNRDPYLVYARRMLKLRPLNPLAEQPDARLRGILFHEAMAHWNKAATHGKVSAPLETLLAIGRTAFEPLSDDEDVMAFWWPRFERIAKWMHEEEVLLRQNLHSLFAEVRGATPLMAGGEEFTLSAIADRLDVLDDGSVRIIDYKTGKPPSADEVKSGFSPQLTLEAAILERGGFAELRNHEAMSASYIQLSGGATVGKIVNLTDQSGNFKNLSREHWDGLQRKLGFLLQPDFKFLPRVKAFKEDREEEYDHLSRHLEWSMRDEV